MKLLRETIERIFDNPDVNSVHETEEFADHFLGLLNEGQIRAAEPDEFGNWTVNTWIKKGIILLFRYGKTIKMTESHVYKFYDKHFFELRPFNIGDGVRIVPGGSSIRTGSYIARGVICMPPSYINVGAYVDSDTLIDSHALVGTCAQLGKRIHLSAASQIGGVLEPAGLMPVIVEDDVLIGGNCGVYEGVRIKRRAVLGSGVILTNSVKVFDLVNERVIQSENGKPLEIPEGAVVVPGSRTINSPYGKKNGLSISSPLIIKYRDEKTDARVALEEALR
ncbi:MAG: 2,3,4,5-tetrahydropyridine-2,6-dicarboxylate N-succinyltransferase [Candidatus Kapabacteria bacterium]|nr:2,3,4,5-tetrahydropyridine-2,6-dicarboxylate N-succinyltransferase [Candidatus Kapabacteria bacterium]